MQNDLLQSHLISCLENVYYKEGLSFPLKRRKETPIQIDDEIQVINPKKEKKTCSLNCGDNPRKWFSIYYTNTEYLELCNWQHLKSKEYIEKIKTKLGDVALKDFPNKPNCVKCEKSSLENGIMIQFVPKNKSYEFKLVSNNFLIFNNFSIRNFVQFNAVLIWH